MTELFVKLQLQVYLCAEIDALRYNTDMSDGRLDADTDLR